ncbi:MAG: DUF2207 domain-containing protein [Acidimicrobiia bacterium]|nr:DUF2207 domain-containing protein [Acidimicrobiia bacterium]
MTGSRRRRWDGIALAGLSLLLGAGAAGAALAGDTERVGDYWSRATVSDGRAQVTEVIDYEFGPNQRRGIFLDVTDLDPGAPVTVDSPTAPDQFTVTAQAGNRSRIRVGDPDRTISGRHRYTIDYPLSTLVQGDTVSWNAVGTHWSVGIDRAELHLIVDRELTGVRCFVGTSGSDAQDCDAQQVAPGHLLVRTGSIGAGDGYTISATMGPAAIPPVGVEEPTGPADDPGTGWLRPAVAVTVAALAGAAALELPIRHRGREQVWTGGSADVAFGPGAAVVPEIRTVDHSELDAMAATEFAPPRDIAASVGGIIHAERVTVDQKMAWIVEASLRDEIEISGSGDDLTLRRGQATPPPSVSNVLTTMFDGRTSIPLGEYDKDFAAGWNELEQQLDDWRDQSDLWVPTGHATQRRWRAWAVLPLLVGLAALGVGAVMANRSGGLWLVVAAVGGLLSGAALAVFVRSHEMLVRSPRGSGLWVQIESFRRFIADSEARHAKMAAEMGLLREYTAWAVTLGELDHWTKTVRAAGLDRESPAFQRDLAVIAATPALCDAVKSASTAPSSSGSSGGSFGGSVGGGGGGSGGGSW